MQNNQTTQLMNKTSNNKFIGCPALMNDGRNFTDYRQSSYVDDMIRYSNNIPSSYEYRQFLIHNGNNIMKVNDMYLQKKLGCENPNAQRVLVPDQVMCSVNDHSSKCATTNPQGVGTRFVVEKGMSPEMNAEFGISGNMCVANFGDAFPLDPRMDHMKYGRF